MDGSVWDIVGDEVCVAGKRGTDGSEGECGGVRGMSGRYSPTGVPQGMTEAPVTQR